MMNKTLFLSVLAVLSLQSVCNAAGTGPVQQSERNINFHDDSNEESINWAVNQLRRGPYVGHEDFLAQVILWDHDETGDPFEIGNYFSWKNAQVTEDFTLENRIKLAEMLAARNPKYQRHLTHLQGLLAEKQAAASTTETRASAYDDGDTSDDDAASDAPPEPTTAGPGTSPAARRTPPPALPRAPSPARPPVPFENLESAERGHVLFAKDDRLNKLRGYRFMAPLDRNSIASRYNPLITSRIDDMATSKKTPYILALISLLSYLARRGFNIEDKYKAAQERFQGAEEALFALVPAARTKSWYKPLSFVVSDAIEATDDVEERAAIQEAYNEYSSALSSYRRWRSGSWGSKLGMYGGAAGAVGAAAFRAHEKSKGYLPDPVVA